MKSKKRSVRRIIKRCAALYRWFTYYRKHVRMIESELGDRLETC